MQALARRSDLIALFEADASEPKAPQRGELFFHPPERCIHVQISELDRRCVSFGGARRRSTVRLRPKRLAIFRGRAFSRERQGRANLSASVSVVAEWVASLWMAVRASGPTAKHKRHYAAAAGLVDRQPLPARRNPAAAQQAGRQRRSARAAG
jgi:hypothetical protein